MFANDVKLFIIKGLGRLLILTLIKGRKMKHVFLRNCPVDPALPNEEQMDLDNWFGEEDEDEFYYVDEN